MPSPTKTDKQRLAAASLGEVADVYGVTLDTVKRWRAEGMPGSPKAYVLHDISKWLRTEGPWKPFAKPVTDDPLLDADGDSPALERYRLAKAKHAELDLEHRRGELINREKCREILSRWAVVIRRMGENLTKRHGNEAAETVNEALEECRSIVHESLSGE